MTDTDPALVDQLMNDLLRPTYVYRMAYSMAMGDPNRSLVRSAQTRLDNARREVDLAVEKYITAKNNE